MAYTNKNYINRVIDIQDITLEHTKRGVTQQWVFDNIIEPHYRISKRTYYKYLALPAKRMKREFATQEI